jgi:hypothetical protein
VADCQKKIERCRPAGKKGSRRQRRPVRTNRVGSIRGMFGDLRVGFEELAAGTSREFGCQVVGYSP